MPTTLVKPRLTDYERAILRPRERLSIQAWSERHLRVTEGPLIGERGASTPWSVETFPLQRAVIEAIDDRRWSRVFTMTAPQAFGKTQCAALPTILHALHHRKVSAAYVAANLNLAVTQWQKKLRPALQAEDDLRALFHDNTDFGGTKEHRRFTNGTSLHCAGADSAGALSGFTAPVIICDDIQAYPLTLPGFGHPADFAFKRSEAFPAGLTTHVGIGTAGTVEDYLWRAMRASALFCPFVPCLSCGTYQLLEFDRLQFNPDDPDAAIDDTWLRCANPKCDHRIDWDELPAMLIEHLWISCPPDADWVTRPADGGVTVDIAEADVYPDTRRNTNVAGFWCNAFYWPLGRTWGERAADWISCRGDPDSVQDYQQNIQVIPWEEPEEDEGALTVEGLAAHRREGHRFGVVPAEADVVTLTVDVHDRFLYYIVRAWNKADGTSWLVDAGTKGVHGPQKSESLTDAQKKARIGHAIRQALEDTATMETQGWQVAGRGDTFINAAICLIDGGYRPDAVNQFCIGRNSGDRLRRWRMIKGKSEVRGTHPIWPREPIRNKRGHVYRAVNVDEAKHALREVLAIPVGQRGAWHTYEDQPLDAYHRHLVSEHFIETKYGGRTAKRWVKRDGAGPNHWWDCETYQIPAALACGVKLLGLQSAQQGKRTTLKEWRARQRKK